jgi:hypothetical protein
MYQGDVYVSGRIGFYVSKQHVNPACDFFYPEEELANFDFSAAKAGKSIDMVVKESKEKAV